MSEAGSEVVIGKLRRPGLPGAVIFYDPAHGIRIQGEQAPAEPAAAAAWCRRVGGWLRIKNGTTKRFPAVQTFVRVWRTA